MVAVAKCSVFVATSLDGFISRLDGSIDWLDEANARVPRDEDCGFAEFLSSVDALVMGRNTFELARSFASWPYGQTPVFVLSRQMTSLPAGIPKSVHLSSEAPTALVARLNAHGMKHLYVDGGVTIQHFLAAMLVEEITVTRIPVLIGTGRPLFGPLAADVRLEHIATRVFDFGFVQSKYRVLRAPDRLIRPAGSEGRAGD